MSPIFEDQVEDDDQNLYWFSHSYDFHAFYNYLTNLDSFISKQIDHQRAQIKKSPEIKQSDNDDENLSEPVWQILESEIILEMYESFSNLFLKSFLISLYTFLEANLAERCRTIEKKHSYSLSLRDLSGTGINQSMNYLIKVHHINYALAKSTEWEEIQNIRRLRNCIVHNGGILSENAERQLEDFIRNESTIQVQKDTKNIILSKQFCDQAIRLLEQFLHNIERAIEQANIAPDKNR